MAIKKDKYQTMESGRKKSLQFDVLLVDILTSFPFIPPQNAHYKSMITNQTSAICSELKIMFRENCIGVERSLDLNLRNEKIYVRSSIFL